MNTKVKIGIAIAIVTALIALIVLDQSTAPGTAEDNPSPTITTPPADSGANNRKIKSTGCSSTPSSSPPTRSGIRHGARSTSAPASRAARRR